MKKLGLLIFCVFSSIGLMAQYFEAGSSQTLFLCQNGNYMATGLNSSGQFGDGTTISSNSPISIPSLSNIIAVEVGTGHSLFLKSDGTVWACGLNNLGQLGDGTVVNKTTPFQIPSLNNVVAISTSRYHSLFLKSDGTVWSCGSNNYGQIGDGTTTNRLTPVQITSLSGIVDIAAGGFHSYFKKSDGTIWACGYNAFGQLGNGGTANQSLPVLVNIGNDVNKISLGLNHTLFLKNNGDVWVCGRNTYGQLGDGTTTLRSTPIQVTSLINVIDVSAGGDFSIFLKNDGTVWTTGDNSSGQLGDGTIVNKNSPIQVTSIYGILDISGGNDHSVFLRSDDVYFSCGKNTNGQLGDGTTINKSLPVQSIGLCSSPLTIIYPHFVHGFTYHDINDDCVKQTSDTIIPFLAMIATPGNLYTSSNDTGYFSLGVYDSINYTLTPIIPQNLSYFISDPCPINYSAYLTSANSFDSTGFDFGFEFAPCHLLRTDVTSNRRRRCARNQTQVYYTNDGIVAANNVEVKVKFDDYTIPISADYPYTYDTINNQITFSMGTLSPFYSGLISIVDSISCVSGISGLTQCTEAIITPKNQCFLDSTEGTNWDRSSIIVNGNCINDTIHFKIKNIGDSGNGDMIGTSEYRIYADNVLKQITDFQLLDGDSLEVIYAAEGLTIRLEADQRPGHPGYSKPRSTVEACGDDGSGGFSIGIFNDAPQDDEDIHIEIDCMEIRDSYDPNIKETSPEGVGISKIIEENTAIDYMIRFQNTGSDTAYVVRIEDTLSSFLDLSTLELGAASFPYSVEITGEGNPKLVFTFNGINLVDSTTNESQSHGFVKYKIKPLLGTPIGTQIDNYANIFFDFNSPIRTNNAFVTIGEFLSTVSVYQEDLNDLQKDLICYPNPTNENLNLKFNDNRLIDAVKLYSIDGKLLMTNNFNHSKGLVTIDLVNYSSGIYFIECNSSNKTYRVKIIKN